MKALVTGGLGFIGSRLAKALVRRGDEVRVLDNCFTGKLSNIYVAGDKDATGNSVRLFRGSVEHVRRDHGDLLDWADVVYHLACRNLLVSASSPDADFETNVRGAYELAQGCRERGTKLVFASSASVYGNALNIPTPEDDPLKPESPYAGSKAAAEQILLAAGRKWMFPVTCLRYSNVYGPGQRPDNPYAGVVAKAFAAALLDQKFELYGAKDTRDYTYVSDVVDATICAATHTEADGKVYNVGTGIETTGTALCVKVGHVAGKLSFWPTPPREIDGISRRCLNISKIREDLGWRPHVGLDEGLERTHYWLTMNTDLWDRP